MKAVTSTRTQKKNIAVDFKQADITSPVVYPYYTEYK